MRVRDVVGEVWRVYRRRFFRFVGLTALVVVPVEVAVAVFDPDYSDVAPSRTGYVASVIILSLVASPVAAAAVIVDADLTERGAPPAVGEVFSRLDRVHSLAAATLAHNLLVLLGTVLLVVPGLLLAARWSLYVAAVALERRSWQEALARSNALVRGRTWTVVGVGLTMLLIALAIAIVPAAAGYLWESVYGSFLGGVAFDLAALPLWGVTAFVLHRRLTALQAADEAATP